MSDLKSTPIFDMEIIKKFDVNGPRYTSYPTADRFVSEFTPDMATRQIKNRKQDKNKETLSLYFHLPFCQSICYYCACNKIITKDHGHSARYLEYLSREISLQRALLDENDHFVSQIHWGGGSPSFLSHQEMKTLMANIKAHFNLHKKGEYAIEVDPRQMDKSTIHLLAELGFNRISVGVQDFDDAVQKAVHRAQSEEETRAVIESARQNGFASISIDLMYGLPMQSVTSFEKTLEKIIAINPDRLSVYNYAHLPALFMPQRKIKAAQLPPPEIRLEILALTIEKLTKAGYIYIGMDHFAKPDDELSVAQREKKLHRNFQGYSIFPDCDMLSFGVSSISQLNMAYYQNHKTLDAYYESIDNKILPVFRGITLTKDDVLRRSVIQSLMCHFEIAMDSFSVDFDNYFSKEIAQLKEYEQSGLISISKRKIIVRPLGRLLIRAFAMIFDKHLNIPKGQYSKVI